MSEGADAGLVGVNAGDERGAGGAAAGAGVEGGKLGAACGETFEIGRGNFAAVAGEIGEAEVVCEDEEDVGFFGSLNGKNEEKESDEEFHEVVRC